MEVTAIYFCFGQHLLVIGNFFAGIARNVHQMYQQQSDSQVWQLTNISGITGKVIAHHHQAGSLASHPFT